MGAAPYSDGTAFVRTTEKKKSYYLFFYIYLYIIINTRW